MTKQNGKPIKIDGKLYCPHCGRQLWSGGGALNHVAACAKRPPEDELRWRVEGGETGASIARDLHVSKDTLYAWLRDAGLSAPGKNGKSADDLEIFPGYAPKYGQLGLKCHKCNALPICLWTVPVLGWSLCEAPDKHQKLRLARRGVDLLQLTTELWVRMPEVWQ